MQSSNKNGVVLITGAAGALGSELAVLCACSGWETILLDSNQRGLNQLYDRILNLEGIEPLLLVQDLFDLTPQHCETIINALAEGPGRLDAIVHCAVRFDGLHQSDHVEPQEWMRQLQVNVNAPWLLSMACLPLLHKSSNGSLCFLAEDLEKLKGAYWGAYGVSKAALETLSAQLSTELKQTDIQVLFINPGAMRSPLRAKVYHSENPLLIKQPEHAAAKIASLLNREWPVESWRVNLDEVGVE